METLGFVASVLLGVASVALFLVYFTKKIVKYLKKKGIIGAKVSPVQQAAYEVRDEEEEE